jgi:hypothetical protein
MLKAYLIDSAIVFKEAAMLYSLKDLFAKLGLPNSDSDIEAFIERYRPLPQAEPLANASFWTPEQAAFLREARQPYSDWEEVVDELNCLLRD